jgi:hypothetical protein
MQGRESDKPRIKDDIAVVVDRLALYGASNGVMVRNKTPQRGSVSGGRALLCLI